MSQQPALEILAVQADLRRIAEDCVGDINEARLVVHNVMSRAFRRYPGREGGLPGDVPERMRREVERLARESGAACA